jgi:hypothetical protein
MTQNELLPIGTQLITKRLAIAAQLIERFTEKDMQYFDPLQEIWVNGFETAVECEYNGIATVEKWCIIVTADNQALLSDVPILGDHWRITDFRFEIVEDEFYSKHYPELQCLSVYEAKAFIVEKDFNADCRERHYPHADATLPAITEKDFCEVIKPKGE